MTEAYKVSTTLTLRNEVSQGLRSIIAELDLARKAAKEFQAALNSLGKGGAGRKNMFSGMSAEAGTAGRKAGEEFSKTFGNAAHGVTRAITQNMEGAFGALDRRAALSMERVNRLSNAGVGRNRRKRSGSGGDDDEGGSGGAGSGKDKEKVSHSIDSYSAYYAGKTALEKGSEVVKKGAEVLSIVSGMDRAGFTSKEIEESKKAAWETTRTVPTSLYSENLQHILEGKQLFGSPEEAIKFLPSMAQDEAINKLYGDTRGSYDTFKFLEMRGAAGDFNRMERERELVEKVKVASGGKVGGSDLMKFMQQAGPAGQNMDEDTLYGYIPKLIQETSGHRAGTMSTAGARYEWGHVMTDRAKQKLVELDMATGTKDKKGHFGDDFKLKGEDVAQNFFTWVKDFLRPGLISKGITDSAAQNKLIYSLGGTSTVGREIGDVLSGYNQFLKDHRNTLGENLSSPTGPHPRHPEMGAMGGETVYQQMMRNDPKVQLEAFSNAWKNFVETLGVTVVPVVVPALTSMSKSLHDLSDFAKEHETLTKYALEAAGLAAALVTLGGALGIVGGALRPLISFLKGAGFVASVAGGTPTAAIAGAVVGGLAANKYASSTTPEMIAKGAPGWGVIGNEFGNAYDPTMDKTLGNNKAIAPPPKDDKPIDVTVNSYLDGRLVAKSVTQQQAKSADRPSQGPSRFDGSRSPSYPGSMVFGGT